MGIVSLQVTKIRTDCKKNLIKKTCKSWEKINKKNLLYCMWFPLQICINAKKDKLLTVTYILTGGHTDRQTDERTYERKDIRTYGCTDGQTEGRTWWLLERTLISTIWIGPSLAGRRCAGLIARRQKLDIRRQRSPLQLNRGADTDPGFRLEA